MIRNDSHYDHDIHHFIGKKLRKQRIKCGLSQSKLADAIGCSYQLIQKHEAGTTRIQVDTLIALTHILGIDLNYFYSGYKKNKSDVTTLPNKGDIIQPDSKLTWNILLAEDNPEDEFLFRKAIDAIATPKKLHIHTCYDGCDTLETLRNHKKMNMPFPDIMFLDLNLPKKDGFTLLREIKRDSNLFFLPIIIISNSLDAQDMLNCYKMQASGYLCKSFDVHEFEKKIKYTIDYWTHIVATPMNY